MNIINNLKQLTILFLGLSLFVAIEANGKIKASNLAMANEGVSVSSGVKGNLLSSKEYSEILYNKINFGNYKKVSKEVFIKAYQGYANLKNAGQLNNKNILTICDFSLSANIPRLWVIDLNKKKVLFNTLVAHGQGTGEEFATAFSNIENSHQSSLGFFTTANTYYGDKGYSLKIEGKDPGFNDQAFNRAIVIHGADYVSKAFINSNKRLGRSWGCPALPQELNRPIIDAIKGGSAFFIYSNNNKYFSSSRWLKAHPPIDASEFFKEEENLRLASLQNINEEDILKNELITPPTEVQKAKVEPKEIPAEAYFQ
ncbi:MAG TPA: murein L,D-transpeptidase catalytic domain family protein [Edaphocola sp.]|nr:murein L,D-transpeptidase catalytic domain family protein [Edaphocola sp.]